MVKEQIMITAFDLFSQYGIKSVSMDDIARNMSISKRTLYGFFNDKENLLVEGLEYINCKLSKYLGELERESLTAVDIVLLFYEELMKRPRWYSKKFYDDLKRYPKAMQKQEADKELFISTCNRLLSRGIKEEVFQEGINVEIVGLLAKERLKMIHPSKSFSKHSNSDVYNTVLITFLRGISTDKGRKILDRWSRTRRIYNTQ